MTQPTFTSEEEIRAVEVEEGVRKVCTKCDEAKLLDEFHRHPTARDGRASWCKGCYQQRHKERYNDPVLREAYRRDAREKSRERNRKFRAESPYGWRAGMLNRKAKKCGVPGKVTKPELEEIWERHAGRCALRGPDCVGEAFEWDHAVPLTRFGSSGAAWNLIPACRHCNAQKNSMTLNEWRRECRWRLLDPGAVGWIDPMALIGSPPEHRNFVGPGIEPVIHETARIEAFCTVDAGTTRATTIGANSWMMKACHAGHDVIVGAACELAPHTVLGGNVILEDGVRCGMGVTVKPFVRVGAGARIGMGAAVLRDVPPGEVWVGNPARKLEKDDAEGKLMVA